MVAGVDAIRFWDMTMAEVSATIKAWHKNQELVYKRELNIAYQTGVFVAIAVNRPKKYPKWRDVEARLDKASKATKLKGVAMSDEEMQARCEMFAKMFG